MERANHDQDLPNTLPLEPRGPIHRHCPKIYLKTCHQIIRWQKLRCHKMLLRHILSQFTKFVWGDLKYSQHIMHCRSHYDVSLFRFRLCMWYRQPYPFYSFVPLPAHTCTSIRPSAQHFHNTAIVTSLRPRAATSRQRWLAAALPVVVVQQHYCTCLSILYTFRSFMQFDVLLFFSSSVRCVQI